jgi:hypothetical protein
MAPANGFIQLVGVVLSTVRGLAMNVALFDVSPEDAERRWRQTRAHLIRLIEASEGPG